MIDREEYERAQRSLALIALDKERKVEKERRRSFRSQTPPRSSLSEVSMTSNSTAATVRRVPAPSPAEQAAVASLEADALQRLGEAMVGMSWRTPISRGRP